MRILVISQYFWPENFRINDLVEGLLERGHEVTVLTGLPNYPSGKFFSGYSYRGPYRECFRGADIVRVPLFARGKGRGINLIFNYLSFAVSATLGGWRCKGKFDAIFVFEPSPVTVGIPARYLSWLKNAPILFWVQDLWPESLLATQSVRSIFLLKIIEGLVRWIYKGCARILVQSEAFVEPVARLGVPLEKIYYFPNSAEAIYCPFPRGVAWDGPTLPHGFRVMFAGNIGFAQSIDTTLAAAEILRNYSDIHWIILGDGRLAEWLLQAVIKKELGETVHLMGQFPMQTMPAWFAQADVMIATLRNESVFSLTIPSKIQSYLACAKPIISAINGEGGRIVNLAGAGISVAADDAPALAGAVLKTYKMSPAERDKLGQNGCRYYKEHFEREALLNKLEVWLVELEVGNT